MDLTLFSLVTSLEIIKKKKVGLILLDSTYNINLLKTIKLLRIKIK